MPKILKFAKCVLFKCGCRMDQDGKMSTTNVPDTSSVPWFGEFQIILLWVGTDNELNTQSRYQQPTIPQKNRGVLRQGGKTPPRTADKLP